MITGWIKTNDDPLTYSLADFDGEWDIKIEHARIVLEERGWKATINMINTCHSDHVFFAGKSKQGAIEAVHNKRIKLGLQ